MLKSFGYLAFGYTKNAHFLFFKVQLLQENALAFKMITFSEFQGPILEGKAKEFRFILSALWPFSVEITASIVPSQIQIRDIVVPTVDGCCED